MKVVEPGWTSAPAAHRDRIVAFLTDVDTKLRSVQQQVGKLTPAPFTGGDAVVAAYRGVVDPLQAKITEYAAEAAVFPPKGIAAVLQLAHLELVSFSVRAPDPDDPGYKRARQLAPNCGGR
ncbi:hypothetical protein ADL03_26900 [Nocardia sp. NRRL S-836]|nr:hypothetical protein ADL03_26900 [Nocardia sp. NRRL S-836]